MRGRRNSRSRPSDELTTFGGLTRSALMQRVRSKRNKTTELATVRLLRAHRITGWRRHLNLPGKPDFAWSKARVALFVHGCFWHGHGCGRNLAPNKNKSFWAVKLRGNRSRDRRSRDALRRLGWKVITIWECQINRSPEKCVHRLRIYLSASSR